MPESQARFWGIDLGQCALKAICLEVREGKPVATAFEYIEYPKILSQPDADPDELTSEALTQFLSRNAIKGDFVAISVPGQSGLARFVKLPPVPQGKIAEIVKFEARQQIPFPLDEVVWDYQPLSTGEIIDGLALETEIGLFAMKRDVVNRVIQQFKQANMEVQLVQMAPLALCNFVSYDLLGKNTNGTPTDQVGNHACIVALEIGTDNSNLVITDGGAIIWQRPIPIGGNHFTRALTKEMKLTFAKAEHLKRNAAKSPELRKILSILKPVLNDFVAEVQRSLSYFANTYRNAQIQYMIGMGNAFRLPGLQKFLQEKLQMEVRKFQNLERTTGDAVTTAPTFAENIMTFGLAYGLALQGANLALLQTNLLPHEIRLERIIRGKKPWAVTAAASLLFGMSVLAFASGVEKSALYNAQIEQSMARLTDIDSQQKALDYKYQSEEAKLKMHMLSLTRIGAGVTDRFNWQLLHQYINYAMPQPNGDRLVATTKRFELVRDHYWTNDYDAQKAYELLEHLRFAKNENPSAEQAATRDAFIKKNLIQINLVGINALYSERLGDYFRKIHKDGNKLIGMSDPEKKQIIELLAKPTETKLPTSGWVVELRGFTYHKAGAGLIDHTIVENLKYPSLLKDPAYTEDMKLQVEKLIGYFNIYKLKAVKNPAPGQFELINKSYLKALVKGMQPEAVVQKKGSSKKGSSSSTSKKPVVAVQAGGGKRNVSQPADTRRDRWRSLGEMAKTSLDDSGASSVVTAMPKPMPIPGPLPNPMPIPGPVGPKEKVNDPEQDGNQPPSVTRTEFVLLFVWREPITTLTFYQPARTKLTPKAPAAKQPQTTQPQTPQPTTQPQIGQPQAKQTPPTAPVPLKRKKRF